MKSMRLPIDGYHLPERAVTYNYRYFLPHFPHWGDKSFCQQRLHELLNFCQLAQINAVQFYVNTRPGVPCVLPHSAEEQEIWANWMAQEVAPSLRQAGISYQLNYQGFLGHGSTGACDMSWEHLIDQNGITGKDSACPIGKVFRKKMGAMLELWASTNPDILWIDDDFRMHNHRFNLSDQMDYYCFCPDHLSLFNAKYGESFTREKLKKELSQSATPSIWRTRWQEFIAETMVETAAWIRSTVDRVSPNTRLALMTSYPDTHSFEGRDWKPFLQALSGKYRPMIRPCCGIYSSNIVPNKQNAVTLQMMEHTTAILHQHFGDEIDFGPELENVRFTTWSNSISNSHYVLMLSQLLGHPHITLSISDLEGSPISDEPTNLTMLQSIRPRLEAIAQLGLNSWKKLGVGVIADDKIGGKAQLQEQESFSSFPLARPLENLLAPLGIPMVYLSPSEASSGDKIIVLDRATAWSLSDQELSKLLGKSLLLNDESAKVLCERNFGEYLGVKVHEKMDYVIHAEIFFDNVLPGVDKRRKPHMGVNWHKLSLDGATQASEFVDANDRRYVGSTIFQNKLGGRVAIYAQSGGCEPLTEWANHARMRHLYGIIQYLSPENFPIFPKLSAHGLTIVRQNANKLLIAFANLGADTKSELMLQLPPKLKITQIQELRHDAWVTSEYIIDDNNKLTVTGDIHLYEWKILLLTHKVT